MKNKYDIIDNYVKVYCKNNKYFIIDLEDLEKISKYGTWYFQNTGYAYCQYNNKKLILHRIIISLGNNTIIDHINRKRYDNRKENLRLVNMTENNINSEIRKDNTSGFIGVVNCNKITKSGKIIEHWKGKIMINRKSINKQFSNKEDAIKWRLQKELELFGDFAPQRHLFEEYGIK